MPAFLHRQDGRLVDHVGQIGAHGPRCGQGDALQIHGLIQLHILGMYFQHVDPARQVRLVHDHAAVKTAGPQKGLVQHLRPVGGRKDQDPH